MIADNLMVYTKNYNIGRPIDHIIVIIPTDDPSIFLNDII